MRRIFPALFVTLSVTLVAACFLLLSADLRILGKAILAQSVMGANFYFWRATNGYFQVNADSAALHTWSLAVEEQFYLLFPVALWMIYLIFGKRSKVPLRAFLLSGFTISLLIAVVALYLGREHATFFLLPSRAWELLTGSLVAVLPRAGLIKHRGTREVISFLGLAMVVTALFFYHKHLPFPGITALLPCLGAAFLIWTNVSASEEQPLTSVGKLLAWRPLVFIGLISYSLYLWHWPIWVFSQYWSFSNEPSLSQGLRVVVLSLAAAVLCWLYVETPFRKKRVCATKKSLFSFAAIATLALAAVAGIIVFHDGMPERFAESTTSPISRASAASSLTGEGYPPVSSTPHRPEIIQEPVVLLWGDSYARDLAGSIETLCQESGLTSLSLFYPGVPPVLRPRVGLHRIISRNDNLFRESLI